VRCADLRRAGAGCAWSSCTTLLTMFRHEPTIWARFCAKTFRRTHQGLGAPRAQQARLLRAATAGPTQPSRVRPAGSPSAESAASPAAPRARGRCRHATVAAGPRGARSHARLVVDGGEVPVEGRRAEVLAQVEVEHLVKVDQEGAFGQQRVPDGERKKGTAVVFPVCCVHLKGSPPEHSRDEANENASESVGGW
jgi:hypothetical protein